MLNILLGQSNVARALVTTDEADILGGYVSETLRPNLPIQGLCCEAEETVGSTSLSAGDLVYVNITSANTNERVFAQPTTILRTVSELKNVTRGPG